MDVEKREKAKVYRALRAVNATELDTSGSRWQRFMTRLLDETDIEERFTEHDLRGKVGSDLASIERAAELLGHTSKEITKRHYRRKPEVIKPVR